MNKRTFFKLSAAILGGSPGARLFGRAPDGPAPGGRLTNWAGNYRYGTDNLNRLTSIEQVRKFVKEHDSLKVLGTRHCFNGIADSTHALISLEPTDQSIALDPKVRTVTVEAGMRYGQLCPYLHDRGFALHNLASLPHISIAGACATATHGSGIGNGNLATAVSGLELVTADGGILTLSRDRDGDTFLGAVVNLGALGVVTRVTLDIRPTFMMRQDVYEDLPLAQLTDHFERIMSSGYSVSLFTDWQKKRINEVWVKRRVEQGDAPGAGPSSSGRGPRPGTSTRSSNSRRRTARSRWECPAPGSTGCLISAWGSPRAAARSCRPSTSSPAGTRSRPSSRSSGCATG